MPVQTNSANASSVPKTPITTDRSIIRPLGSVTIPGTNAETIQGTGIIGNGGLTLVNSASGIINANVTGQTLTINPGNVLDAHSPLQNQGVLEATNGGTLLFVNQNVVNTNNTITATGTGSSLLLQYTTINGGTLATSGGGTMQTVSSATLNGVTLNGNYLSDLGTTTTISGTISHTGTLTINAGSGYNTYLNIAGSTTLTGGTTTLAYTGSGTGAAYYPAVGRQPDAYERRDDPGHRHHRQRRPDARQQRERHHQCKRHRPDAHDQPRQRPRCPHPAAEPGRARGDERRHPAARESERR